MTSLLDGGFRARKLDDEWRESNIADCIVLVDQLQMRPTHPK